jgi:hypothetical protein
MRTNSTKRIIDDAPEANWPEPEPLIAPAEAAAPYPIDAVPPTMRAAIEEYQRYGQQPMALVACSALGSASLAAQGLVDIARDRNLVGPVSLNIAVIAASGERKTSADKRMTLAVRKWQSERREAMKPQMDEARARLDAHEAERDGLLGKIRSGAGKTSAAGEADVAAYRRQLEALDGSSPKEPVIPELFHEDNSPEALAQAMALGWPSSSLWSDEAGIVVGAHGLSDDSAMRYLTLLNRFWDGGEFTRKRTTAKSFTIRGRRLTCSLMMQEIVLARLLSAGGGATRGVGFMARFLMAWPGSTMGLRLYREGDLSSGALTAFDDRITDLLNMPLPIEGEDMVLIPRTLPLDPPARRMWIEFHDDIERKLGRLGILQDVADFAAKSAENAGRIAGVLHTFENGPEGEIGANMMAAGCALASWHLSEAQRAMGALDTPADIADARLLLDWLLSQEGDVVAPRNVSQFGPARLRQKTRRNAAINVLLDTANIMETKIGGTTVYRINSKLRGAV